MSKKNVFFSIGAHIFSLIYSQLSFSKAWNSRNNPQKLSVETGAEFEYNLDKLPKEGALSKKPWPDDYWPTYKRGLAQRWQGDLNPIQHPDESDSDFAIRKNKERFFTEKELLYMSEEERNKLSPAEKYDIINKDYNYSLTKSELQRTSPDAAHWEGLCHGWAPAAMHFDEPGPCKIEFSGNPFKGYAHIPFATSDTKALLTILQGNYNPNAKTYFVGTRCNDKKNDIDWENSPHKDDINAGAFHIILSNRIALLDLGFVFDRTVDAEVWNQPVEAFKTRVIKEQAPDLTLAAPGTKKEVHVETIVSYTVESDPHPEPIKAEDRISFVIDQPYEYILELDENNNIIGGRFVGDHPDFLWSESKAKFKGIFKNLRKIYNKATGRWFFQ